MLPLKHYLLKQLSLGFVCAYCAALTCNTYLAQQAFSANQLVTFEQASKNGLQRAWFAQVRVDPARNLVAYWTLSNNELFALTTSSTVHAMNAETGKTLWIAQIGNSKYPSDGPVTNSNRVALLNGTTLYLLDRGDGHVLWTREVGDAVVAAPVLSDTFAYVAQTSGRVEGFPLDSPTGDAWQYQSVGRIFHSPAATGPFVAWPTDRGYLYVGNADKKQVSFRIETNEDIIAAPAEWGSLFFVASLDGCLYCYDGSTGKQRWRYSTGMPIISKPVVVDSRVFVTSEMPALHAVDATTGNRLWTVKNAVNFVAQGTQHIYAADPYGNLLIVDKQTGGIAGQLNTGDGVFPIVNEQSDRIFLVSNTGLVQCLHEIGANEPTLYRKTTAEEEAEKSDENQPGDKAAPAAEEKTTEAPDEDADDPFGNEPDAAEDDNPFDDF